MISEDFKNRLIEQGINPDDMIKFSSWYDSVYDVIRTRINTKDGKEHQITTKTGWYASRKNKRW